MKFEFDRVLNTSLKVYSQLYVGIRPYAEGQATDRAPLAFATPYENTAAGKKRQDSVNSWNREQIREDNKWVYKNGITKIVDNKPRGGFRITDDVKRVYWGGGNVVFRVEDPDGWEVEIQSSNLMALIQVSGINEGGLIPGYCMWGRDSTGKNILLHERSDEYKNAILAAEAVAKPKQLGVGGRELGSVYRLKDGQAGAYLGKVWVVPERYADDYDTRYRSEAIGMRGVGKFIAKDLQGETAMFDVELHGSGYNSDKILGEPEQFEAVRIVSDDSETVRLYKKAYLIELIQSKLFDLTPETAADWANQHKLEWAGGGRNDSPRWCFATKPEKPVYDLAPVSEQLVQLAIDKTIEVQRRSRGYAYNGVNTRWIPNRPSYGLANIVQKVDGQLVSDVLTCTRPNVLIQSELHQLHKDGYSHENDVLYGLPFFIIKDGTGTRQLRARHVWNGRDNRQRPISYYGAMPTPVIAQGTQRMPLLPSFSTEELLTDYLETHYKHDLFQVIVKDSA
jgi:hypothetical protein